MRFVGECKTESVSKVIEFYEKCILFRGISSRSKKVLASKSFYVKYPANSVILKQDEMPYNVYFVYKGAITVVRRVNKSDISPKNLTGIFAQKYEELKPNFLLQVETIRKNFGILTLDENSSFADIEVLNNQRMQNSILSTLPSEIVHVPFFQVLDNLSLEEVTQLKMNSTASPSNL